MKKANRITRFFGTLRGRLIISVALVHAVMMTLFIIDLSDRQQKMILSRQQDDAVALSHTLSLNAAGWLASQDLAGLQELVDAQHQYPEIIFAILTDEYGRILAHSDKSKVGQFIMDIPGKVEQTILSKSGKLVDVFYPSLLSGRHVGWVRIGLGQTSALEKLNKILRSGLFYALFAIIIGSFIAWIMGRRITRRLHAVQDTISKVATGNSEARSHITGTDEAAILANEFNEMLDALAERDAALGKSEARFKKLFSNAAVPLGIVNKDGVITNLNLWFEKTFGYIIKDIPTIKEWWQFAYPDDGYRKSVITRWETAVQKALEEKTEIETQEYRVTCKNGEERTVLISGTIINEDILATFYDITERKKTEELVRKQKEQYDGLVNNIPVGVYKFRMKPDGSMSFDYISPRLCKMIRVKEEEAYGDIMNAFKVIHKDDFAGFIQLIKESFIAKQNFSWEGRAAFGDQIQWMRIESTPKVLENGDILWDGIMADITEQKKNEEKNRINEAKLTKAQQIGKLGYWQKEINSNMIWGSEEARKIYGFSPVAGELTEDEVDACIPDIARVRQAAIDLLRQNKKYDIEFQVNPADGSPAKYISAVAEIERDEQGNPFRIMGVLKDITEYKKGEQQIIKEKDLSDSIINSLPGIFYLQGYSGKYLRWNKKFETVTGYDAGEIGNLDPLDFFEGEEKAAIVNKIGEVLANGSADIETVIITKSGKRIPYYLSGQLIQYEDKPCFIGVGVDITERKIADDKFRSSEKARKLIMDSALDAIVSMDTAGFITGWTPQAEKIFGWKEAEVMGKTVSETIVPLNYREKHSKGFQQYLKTGKGRFINNLVEISALNKEGKEFPVEMMITPINQDGTDYFCAFIRDITERKKAEEEIIASEKLYRDLFQNMHHGFAYCKGIIENGKVIDYLYMTVNFKFEEILKVENINGKKLSEVFPEAMESDPSYAQILQEVVIHGKTIKFETNYKPNSAWLSVTFYKTGNENFVLLIEDIAERKKAEAALRESEETFRRLFNESTDAILLLDNTGFIDCNHAAASILGYSSLQEVLNKKPWDISPEKQPDGRLSAEKAEAMVAKALELGFNRFEWVHTKLDGTEFPVEVMLTSIILKGKQSFFTIWHDITERKKAEEEIKSANKQLRQLTAHLQSIREEERKRIGREIHDDLGQQLTAIKMDVAWIDKKTPDESSIIKPKLKNIITLLDGSNQSVRRILSELKPGILDELRLLDAIEWHGKQFTGNTGIPVVINVPGTVFNLPEAMAACIFRVYQESLTNIARYANAKNVWVTLKLPANKVMITIEDDGTGFDIATLKNKNTFGILGMKERVYSLNGSFDLESVPGQGTIVSISLPYST